MAAFESHGDEGKTRGLPSYALSTRRPFLPGA